MGLARRPRVRSGPDGGAGRHGGVSPTAGAGDHSDGPTRRRPTRPHLRTARAPERDDHARPARRRLRRRHRLRAADGRAARRAGRPVHAPPGGARRPGRGAPGAARRQPRAEPRRDREPFHRRRDHRRGGRAGWRPRAGGPRRAGGRAMAAGVRGVLRGRPPRPVRPRRTPGTPPATATPPSGPTSSTSWPSTPGRTTRGSSKWPTWPGPPATSVRGTRSRSGPPPPPAPPRTGPTASACCGPTPAAGWGRCTSPSTAS